MTVTGTEQGNWWEPFMDRQGSPMRSRVRTANPGKIRARFDDVSIGGVRLQSERDFPNGLEIQGDVNLTFRAPWIMVEQKVLAVCPRAMRCRNSLTTPQVIPIVKT